MTDELFVQLREWSKQKNSYSIKDFAKQIEIPYKKILDSSKENEDWEDEFEMARTRLDCNALKALEAKKINFDKWLRYAYENDVELREIVRKEGEVIPEDEDEFDVWVVKKIREDKIKYGS